MSNTDKMVRRSGVKLHLAGYYETVLTVDSITGSFKIGETVTGGTSSATGILMYDDETGLKLYLVSVTGTFQAAETITGADSGATAPVATAGVDDTNGWTPYVRFAKPQGQIQLRDTRGVQTITDFDSTESEFAAKLTDAREGNLNWNANLSLADDGQLMARFLYRYDVEARMKRVRTSIDGTVSETQEWQGFFSDKSENDQEQGVAQATLQFEISSEGPFA